MRMRMFTPVLGCPVGSAGINFFRINGLCYFTDPYKWGILGLNIPLILTIDPNILGHPSKQTWFT